MTWHQRYQRWLCMRAGQRALAAAGWRRSLRCRYATQRGISVKIVVTGASGNVGTALLRRLAGTEHHLVGISRRAPADIAPYQGVEWHLLDVGAPDAAERLTAAFRGADAVVHLAWLVQPGHQRELLRRVNQGGTRAVIDAVHAAGIGHLVHMSSVGTYAPAHGEWKAEDWSTAGVPTSAYSVDKAAGERMLDGLSDDLLVTRVRPGLILHPDAASEISRYFLGRLVPRMVLRRSVLKLAPLPRNFAVQFVHSDDVAAALAAILNQRAGGAFNLAADPVIDRAGFAAAIGGTGPALPVKVVRVGADLTWRAHLQPTDRGWIDLAFSVPLLSTDRARSVLGWEPEHSAVDTLRRFVDALHEGRGKPGPILYPRGHSGG
jgi:UDP-glucose 4-epimerase